jgi:putative PIN family toxin of toxin-antitoxin system
MIKAVFDSNLLISAFLTRNSGGISTELLRFVIDGAIELYLSLAIADEVAETLTENERARARYRYTEQQVVQYRADLLLLATVVDNPPAMRGAVPRDPDDDKIIACAVAAGVGYLVTRDHDLLSLDRYGAIEIISPETFLRIVRQEPRVL